MIVRCEQCQVRFKVPDEKVTERGVRVRCARCSHTFRVGRGHDGEAVVLAPAAAEAPSNAVSVPDPFAHFGTPQSHELPQNPTVPGRFDLGIAASRSEAMARVSLDALPAVRPSNESVARHQHQPPPSAATPQPFDFGDFQAPAAAPPQDFGKLAFDFGDSAAEAAVPPFSSAPKASTPKASAPLESAEAAADDFFATAPTRQTDNGKPKTTYNQTSTLREELFDMSFAAKPTEAPPAEPFVDISMATEEQQHASHPSGEVRTESSQSILTPLPGAPPPGRLWVSVLANAVVALILVATLLVLGSALANEGSIDAKTLSWERLKSIFVSSGDLKTFDISNGLYETRAGRPVFFVRGEVENRGTTPAVVVIKAEILDGTQVVRSAESPAGAAPSAEELYAIASSEDFAALNVGSNRRVKPLAPGERAQFVVPFREYPPDLKGFQVRVSAAIGTAGTAHKEP